jgi:hypothetical protein
MLVEGDGHSAVARTWHSFRVEAEESGAVGAKVKRHIAALVDVAEPDADRMQRLLDSGPLRGNAEATVDDGHAFFFTVWREGAATTYAYHCCPLASKAGTSVALPRLEPDERLALLNAWLLEAYLRNGGEAVEEKWGAEALRGDLGKDADPAP